MINGCVSIVSPTAADLLNVLQTQPSEVSSNYLAMHRSAVVRYVCNDTLTASSYYDNRYPDSLLNDKPERGST